MLKRIFFLLLFLPTLVNAAHITDKLLAGMYAKPTSAEQPVQLLPSGTPVELMGEQDGFVKVQLVDGKTGWVEKRFLSEEKPAKVRLLSLQSKYRQLQEKLDRAEEKLTDLNKPTKQAAIVGQENQQKANGELQAALAKAEDEIQQLKQHADQTVVENSKGKTTQAVGVEYSASIWVSFLLLLVIAVLAGVYLGMKIQDTRQLKRHGGFRI
ncbi:MAG: TIGR04211 family SH3 domain-containing protein [Cycloclasticus sp.]|nr:TIGR04211 family SH3 domain-containing protein [Cycloclasticus sp.]